jgi:ankyrin repeat protein
MASVNSVASSSCPWKTALQLAAARGDETKVQELLREAEKLLPDGFEDGRRIVLQDAAGQGRLNIVRLLLTTNPTLDASGLEAPALLRAVEWNHFPIVRILLENGANTEARDRFERTAIFAAAARRHVEALQLLFRFGANVNARDCDDRNVLIYVAAHDVTTRPSARKSTEGSVQMLLSTTPININAKDKTHRTALHWAAASGKVDMVRLLASGDEGRLRARLDVTNNRGRTPLHLATDNNHIEIVRILLDSGADPSLANDGGWTALHIAADKGHEDIVDLLLRRGVDINAETKLGETPLHWAAWNGHLTVTKLLLRHPEIRRDKRDAAGNTPLVQAAQNHHPAIVQLLSSSTDGSHLSAFAVHACKEYKAAVVNFYPEKTEKGRFAAVTRPSVFDLLYGKDVSGIPLISTIVENQRARKKKTQHFEPPFRWIHLPANNVC